MITIPKKTISMNISPFNLASYLRVKGWVADGEVFGQAVIWHRFEPECFDFEVLQPKTINVAGYHQRIWDAVNSIAEFEKRDSLYVVKDIENFHSDLVKIRVVHSDVEVGTIPIDDGVLLIEKSRDLLTASTLSTFSKKAYFTGQRSVDVQNYIKQLRLGQTEIGSFVVNLVAPIIDTDDDQLDQNKISLTRAVTNNLSRSLLALNEGIHSYEKTSSVSEFEAVIKNGVSANLCDALVGLSGANKSRTFSINICLAGAESDNQDLPKKFEFKPSQVPMLELASAYYKGNYTISNYEALGVVSKMKHLPDEDFGEITIKSVIRGVEKNVVIQLILDHYWEAVHAHEKVQLIACQGILHVTAKSAKLLDSKGFRVVDNQNSTLER